MRPGLSLTNIIVIVTCIILIILVLLVYIRSRQGDQRIIQATNQMLLPLLAALALTLGVIYNFPANAGCIQGIPNILRYIGAVGAVLITLIGLLRYAFSQSRDRRLITHAVLLAIVFATVIFIIEQFVGCT